MDVEFGLGRLVTEALPRAMASVWVGKVMVVPFVGSELRVKVVLPTTMGNPLVVELVWVDAPVEATCGGRRTATSMTTMATPAATPSANPR